MASKTEEQQLVDAFKTIFQDVSSGSPPPFVQSMRGDANPGLTQMGRDAQSGRLPNMGVPGKVSPSLEGFLKQGVPPGISVALAGAEAKKQSAINMQKEGVEEEVKFALGNKDRLAADAFVRSGQSVDDPAPLTHLPVFLTPTRIS